jgi:maltose phosphorylase
VSLNCVLLATFQGSYIANLLSRQDKSRLVENGYPEYFAKVLNAPNWIESIINGENLI